MLVFCHYTVYIQRHAISNKRKLHWLYVQVYLETWKYMFLRRSLAHTSYLFFFCRYIWGSCPPPPNTKKLATLVPRRGGTVSHSVSAIHSMFVRINKPVCPQGTFMMSKLKKFDWHLLDDIDLMLSWVVRVSDKCTDTYLSIRTSRKKSCTNLWKYHNYAH